MYSKHDFYQEPGAVLGEALDATADIARFAPPVPVIIVRWGYVCTVPCTVTIPICALDKEVLAGKAAGRINAWGGTLTPGALPTEGQGFQHSLLGTEGPALPVLTGVPRWLIIPGEAVIIQVTTAATAGDGRSFIEYEPWGGQGRLVEFNTALNYDGNMRELAA